jgi:hypothetical protein
MFYQTHHAREWNSTIMCLEAEQPLLKLCSSNWKVNHVLGNSLIAIVSKESYASKIKQNKKKQKKGKEREGGKEVNNNASDGSEIAHDNSGNGRGGGFGASSSKSFIIMNL